eukprot:3766347-Amphidinium_carterae.1
MMRSTSLLLIERLLNTSYDSAASEHNSALSEYHMKEHGMGSQQQLQEIQDLWQVMHKQHIGTTTLLGLSLCGVTVDISEGTEEGLLAFDIL